MKILHIVPTYYPCLEAGGVVNAVYKLSKKQAEEGNDVSVFTTDSCIERMKLDKRYNVDIEGVKVYYFRNLSNSLKTKFLIDTPYHLPLKIRKEIKKYDIVHIHEHRHSLAIAASHYASKNNIPYVIQAHGSVLPFFQKEKLKEIFDKLWGFKILKNASKVFALTNVEKEQYLKMGVEEERIEIVPLGIDIEEYSKLPSKGNFREKYNISENDKLLLFIGRIHKIKGLDLLVNSLDVLNREYIKKNVENLKLAIIGPDNGFLAELKKVIADLDLEENIIITGPLFNKDKIEAIVDCDIFIMPSQYESFTTSGLEAMACGKPLILTKNNHIHTWVDNNTGLSAEYDKNDLADKIQKLLADEKLMEKFGKNGLKEIKENYNWDSIEKKIDLIYRELIE
ncbi:LPS biosynthesis protein RfbU [Methanobrevibacter arboriphilus]|jgi:glycosyltransferase involved in cell wall biosynthesis|uniref:LPS biosynthesis protein RfbU n=1 Tax=Methanobrevibacter arboriphilus TaxID=39441 RepID=A0ACA8R4M3_METAZ|nr:glycosyltransferase [Methanobrevibacter arboriphilus]MCC7561440.1 glycosyltransferase [Methanobrevibacter arboriphilus]BBL62562.1 LPS biosynthesis protein RfbU [Methanobrevibacter arboriphilus]GLI11704.1 LPS biosynthesis protein RfbU [Methanobrevibacter arboriphilus]